MSDVGALTGQGGGRAGTTASREKKRWTPPRIVQCDLLETVAGLCEGEPGSPDQPKSPAQSCGINQT